MFPRTSSFTQDQKPVSRGFRQADVKTEPARRTGPSPEELNKWYDTLVDLIERESEGDVDHTTELTGLRDQIYVYLY